MNLYDVKYSGSKSDKKLINVSVGSAEVYADTEDEVRVIFKKEMPDKVVTEIKILQSDIE